MATFFNFEFLGNSNSHSASHKRAKQQRQGRTCRFEELEGREMLSVTPWSVADDVFGNPGEPETVFPCAATQPPALIDAAPALAPLGAATSVYNQGDWNKIQAAKTNNGLNDSQITWEEINGEYRLTGIQANYASMKGILDLSGCTSLQTLSCFNTKGLQGINVSGCESLQSLYCYDSGLTELNVRGCKALGLLECKNNSLATLDITDCTNLKELYCYYNQLQTLDMSKCTKLTHLSCYSNQLSTLNITGCMDLRYMDCGYNYSLTGTLDVSGRISLTELYCNGNQLTALNITGCTNLEKLHCNGNQLTTLNVTGFALLDFLECGSNPLKTLNVTGCTSLEYLHCYGNQLTTLDVSGCKKLLSLECGYNQLTTLNVSGCTNLQYLYCYGNQLTTLNVSGCTNLQYLYCYGNELTTLDVSGCIYLWYLECGYNQLTTLNLSGCTNLQYLYCYGNQLTALDASGCSNLYELYCYDNQLTTLKTTDYTQYLYCENNRLKFSTLPANVSRSYYSYAVQDMVPITIANNTVDLSSEHGSNVGGTTTYTWYYASGTAVDYRLYTDTNGMFFFTGLLEGDVIYCTMANTEFPGLLLTTSQIKIDASLLNEKLETPVVTVTGDGRTSIAAEWNAVPNASAYVIEWSKDAAFTKIVTYTVLTDTKYAMYALDADTTYYVHVRALGTEMYGNSDWSNVDKTTTDPVVVLPPPSIAVTENSSTSVTVNWDAISNASGYKIEWSIDDTFKTGIIMSRNLTAAATEYVVVKLDAETIYHFRVVAIGSENYENSNWSNVESVTTDTAPVLLPLPAPSITATCNDSSLISVTWDDVGSASGYVIEWSKDQTFSEGVVYSTVVHDTAFDITNLDANTTFYVRVMTLGSNGYPDSFWSDTKPVKTDPVPDAVPLDEPVISASSEGTASISLKWNAIANADGYKIEWSKDAAFRIATSTIISGTEFVITDLDADTEYHVRIMALGGGIYSDSSWSNAKSAKTEAVSVVIVPDLDAPAITLTNDGNASITVQWDTDGNASGYRVEWSKDITFGIFTSTVTTDAEFVIAGLDAGTVYYVRVMALGSKGYNGSDWSKIESAKTEEIVAVVEQLSAPTINHIVGQGEGEIIAAWSAVENTNRYEVKYAETRESLANAVPVSTANGWVSLSGLKAGKTYYFQVRAIGSEAYSDSDWSGVVSIAIDDLQPVTQSVFYSTDRTADSVTLAWSAGKGTPEIQYRVDADKGTWSSANITITGNTAVVTGLESGTTYAFRIKGGGGNNGNGWSSDILVTTYANANVVTLANQIDNSLAPVKGVKLDKKHTKPTQTSLAFTWYPAAAFNADEITLDVIAPKPKHWAKKTNAPCVATVTITADQLADILAGDSLIIESGDCAFTITQKVNGAKVGIEVKVTGLAMGTKYTVNMQAKTGDVFSKVTKVSVSTKKYAAPKGKVNNHAAVTAGIGSVVFELHNASKTAFTGAKTGYEIGIFVGKECLFGGALIEYMMRAGIRFDGDGVTVSPTGVKFTGEGKVTASGLASQKYTFGIRETATIDGTEAGSAIAKISAAPLVYNAPKITTPVNGATTLTWTPVRAAAEGQTIIYVVGAFDSTTKGFAAAPAIIETTECVSVDISELGLSLSLNKIGVQEVLIDSATGNVIAKSAVAKIYREGVTLIGSTCVPSWWVRLD